MTGNGTIRVEPVLFCAPVFWEPHYWSPETHEWEWVEAETPLDEKPSAEFVVSLDITLGELIEAACDSWSILAGADLLKHGGTRAQQFVRFAFVRPERDASGVDAQEGYGWPSTLPVARGDGTVDQVDAFSLPYRDILVSSKLGLIEGDAKRPYVHPVIPQGDAGSISEFGHLAVAAVHAAYAEVDDFAGTATRTLVLIRASLPEAHHLADTAIDEWSRSIVLLGILRWLRKKFRRRRGSGRGGVS